MCGFVAISLLLLLRLLRRFLSSAVFILLTSFSFSVEKALTTIVKAVLNPILKALGIKPISLPDLPENVPNANVSLPALPSVPDFAALEKVEEVTETILDFPETIYDKMMDKIPSSLPFDVFDNVQDVVESANIFFDDMKALNDVTASILGDISGCSETEIIQVPSLVTLFQEAGLGDGWDDCTIEVPLCTKLDMPDISDKLAQLARLLAPSKFMQLLKIQSRNRRLSAEAEAAKKFLETVFKYILNDSIGLDYDSLASGNYTLSIPLMTLDWSFLKYAREMNLRGKSSWTFNECKFVHPGSLSLFLVSAFCNGSFTSSTFLLLPYSLPLYPLALPYFLPFYAQYM